MFAISKITLKGQTTIPKRIRIALNVAPGDSITWEILDNGMVNVRGIRGLELGYLRSLEDSLSEWVSIADEEAYREL